MECDICSKEREEKNGDCGCTAELSESTETAGYVPCGFLVQWHNDIGYSYFTKERFAITKKVYLENEGLRDVKIIPLFKCT